MASRGLCCRPVRPQIRPGWLRVGDTGQEEVVNLAGRLQEITQLCFILRDQSSGTASVTGRHKFRIGNKLSSISSIGGGCNGLRSVDAVFVEGSGLFKYSQFALQCQLVAAERPVW